MIEGNYPRDAVQHIADGLARRVLDDHIARQPQIKEIIDKVAASLEHQFYTRHLADAVRVSKSIEPRLFATAARVAADLGVPVPHLFLTTNPVPNAWCIGSTNSAVVVTTGLLDLLDEAELGFVVAHEIGHIVCDHGRYRLLTQHFDIVAAIISLVPLVGPYLALLIRAPLFYWYRRSELSADRYGRIACGSGKVAMSTLAKLAGGRPTIDPDELCRGMLAQATEFREALHSRPGAAGLWDAWDSLVVERAQMAHPWPAVRVWEIDHWEHTNHFLAISQRDVALARRENGRQGGFFLRTQDPSETQFSSIIADMVGDIGGDMGAVVGRGMQSFRGLVDRLRVDKPSEDT
jgi:Zn-dependent protease with chaperone function